MSQSRTNKVEQALAYSPAKAARLCGVSRPTFIKHIQSKLNVKRVGRRVVIPRDALEAFLNSEQSDAVGSA